MFTHTCIQVSPSAESDSPTILSSVKEAPSHLPEEPQSSVKIQTSNSVQMPAKNEITLYNDLMIKFNQVATDHLTAIGYSEEAHQI